MEAFTGVMPVQAPFPPNQARLGVCAVDERVTSTGVIILALRRYLARPLRRGVPACMPGTYDAAMSLPLGRRMLGASSLALVLVAGCGAEQKGGAATSEDAAPKVSQSESPKPPATDEAIEPYVDAIASQDATQQRDAAKAAMHGSLAAAYATHQANVAEAALDGGYEVSSPGDVTDQGDGFKACYTDDEGSPCYVYDAFKLSPAGKVASFTIDGKPLAGRLVVGDGAAKTSALGNVTLLSAYTTQTGALSVATKIRTKGEPIYIHDAAARYRAPDGRQRGQNMLTGPSEIGSDSTALVVFSFQGPIGFGGAMTVELNQKDNETDPASLTLNLK